MKIYDNFVPFKKCLTDADFGLEEKEMKKYRHRFGARGIIVNDLGKVALLYKEKKNEYKLIGGGVYANEDPEVAFIREALEECGCHIEIEQFLGTFEEIKSQDAFKQTSYIYLAHVVLDTGSLNLTAQEKGEGSRLVWCDIDEAISLVSNSLDHLVGSIYEGDFSVYHARFIVRRDAEILKFYASFQCNYKKNS